MALRGSVIGSATFGSFSVTYPSYHSDTFTSSALATSDSWVQVFVVGPPASPLPPVGVTIFSNVINSSFHYNNLFDYDFPAVGARGARGENFSYDRANTAIPQLDYPDPSSLINDLSVGEVIKVQWASGSSSPGPYTIGPYMAFAVSVRGSFIDLDTAINPANDGILIANSSGDFAGAATTLSILGLGPTFSFSTPPANGAVSIGAFAWDDPTQTPVLSGAGWENLGVFKDSTTGFCGMAVGKIFAPLEADSTVTATFASAVNISANATSWQQTVLTTQPSATFRTRFKVSN